MWRGVACLLVVIFHSTTLHGVQRHEPASLGFRSVPESILFLTERLWIGVPMFFVISGYCISATAAGMQKRAQPVQTYLVRRFRRIYPPYWAAMLTYVLVVAAGRLHHKSLSE